MGSWPKGFLDRLANLIDVDGTLVAVGVSGAGKTTAVRDLHQTLVAAGRQVYVLGADPGQAAWGPPACVSLVAPRSDSAQLILEFTGSLDPIRHLTAYALALQRLMSRVPPASILLVDAPGIVRGWVAIRFMEFLFAMVRPTVVISLAHRDTDRILRDWLDRQSNLACITPEPDREAARMSRKARYRARTEALERYLEKGKEIELARNSVEWLGPVPAGGGWCGSIVGLLGEKGETVALGEVTGVTSGAPEEASTTPPNLLLPVSLSIRCPLDDARNVRRVVFGTVRRDASGMVVTAGTRSRRPHRAPSPWALRSRPTVQIPIAWPESGGSAPYLPRMLNSLAGDPALMLRHKLSKRALLFDLGWLEPVPAKVLHAVTDVFVTHTHMDHFQGLVTLLRMLMGTGGTVRIYGPKGIDANLAGLLEAFRFNLLGDAGPRFVVSTFDRGRVEVVRYTCNDPPRVEPLDSRPCPDGILLDQPEVTVGAFELRHNTPVLAYHCELHAFPVSRREGVPVEQRSFRLLYVADAADNEHNRKRIVQRARGVDLFVCETMFTKADELRARQTGHLTARAAAEMARDAAVGRLVPFHFSPRYEDDPSQVYREILSVFDRVVPAVSMD